MDFPNDKKDTSEVWETCYLLSLSVLNPLLFIDTFLYAAVCHNDYCFHFHWSDNSHLYLCICSDQGCRSLLVPWLSFLCTSLCLEDRTLPGTEITMSNNSVSCDMNIRYFWSIRNFKSVILTSPRFHSFIHHTVHSAKRLYLALAERAQLTAFGYSFCGRPQPSSSL